MHKSALLTAIVMVAFAANSVLNRLAVGAGEIDPVLFALIRVASGAGILVVLALALGRGLPLLRPARIIGALSLTLYLFGFSIAYLRLDAGLGALILFGVTQVVMFAGAFFGKEQVAPARTIGAAIGLLGLAWLLWPTGTVQIPALGWGFMVAAGLGWGLYSLAGTSGEDPLAATAANFLLALPVCLVLPMLLPVQMEPVAPSPFGIGLAVVSGAITSGLGYALWYHVLPRLGGSAGGLVQLSVPVIAVLGGLIFLGEAVSLRLVLAGALVLGGIAFGLLVGRKTQ